jgi:hypothetical protein
MIMIFTVRDPVQTCPGHVQTRGSRILVRVHVVRTGNCGVRGAAFKSVAPACRTCSAYLGQRPAAFLPYVLSNHEIHAVLGLVYFSAIFTPEKCGDMWGFGIHPILLNPLKYSTMMESF